MADVNITVDGKKVTAPAGTLLIEACKSVGIEVPSFCYYPNLSLQGACRMCLVKIEKMPKLQTACTTVITEGMSVTTDSPEIHQARKGMVELLLGNHPLDCPVCDAGGECRGLVSHICHDSVFSANLGRDSGRRGLREILGRVLVVDRLLRRTCDPGVDGFTGRAHD